MFLKRICLLTCILIYSNCDYLKVAIANTIHRFDFNFNINDNSFKTSLNIKEGEEDKVNGTEVSAIASPISLDIWSKQAQLNATANDKLQATIMAVSQLENEFLVVAGHSEFIAAKIKLMTNYLRNVNSVTATNAADAAGVVGGHASAAANRFVILQDYVQLVDDLRATPTREEGGERSLDYMVMKLGLEKHKLIELQTKISVEVLQAMETWQAYEKKQLVDVAAV